MQPKQTDTVACPICYERYRSERAGAHWDGKSRDTHFDYICAAPNWHISHSFLLLYKHLDRHNDRWFKTADDKEHDPARQGVFTFMFLVLGSLWLVL